jgi:hypothetical protein
VSGKTTLNRILHEHGGSVMGAVQRDRQDNSAVRRQPGAPGGRSAKSPGQLAFDCNIETTGLATPGPVAQTFFMDEGIHDEYLLDAVITVVDAKHGQKQLDEHDEARAQVGFADRILLSKTDLVAEADVADLMDRLRDMNPRAQQKKVHFGETDIREILDIRGFNLSAALEIDPAFLEEGHHHHDDDVKSFVWKDPRPLQMEKIETFLSLMVQNYGEDLLRWAFSTSRARRRMIFQASHADGRHPRQALGGRRDARERDGVHRPAHPAPPLRGRPGVLRRVTHAPACSRSATFTTNTPGAPSSRCRPGTWPGGRQASCWALPAAARPPSLT